MGMFTYVRPRNDREIDVESSADAGPRKHELASATILRGQSLFRSIPRLFVRRFRDLARNCLAIDDRSAVLWEICHAYTHTARHIFEKKVDRLNEGGERMF